MLHTQTCISAMQKCTDIPPRSYTVVDISVFMNAQQDCATDGHTCTGMCRYIFINLFLSPWAAGPQWGIAEDRAMTDSNWRL